MLLCVCWRFCLSAGNLSSGLALLTIECTFIAVLLKFCQLSRNWLQIPSTVSNTSMHQFVAKQSVTGSNGYYGQDIKKSSTSQKKKHRYTKFHSGHLWNTFLLSIYPWTNLWGHSIYFRMNKILSYFKSTDIEIKKYLLIKSGGLEKYDAAWEIFQCVL